MAARVRLPYFSSLPSKRSNSVKASAVPPAKPAITLSLASRRTLRALPLGALWGGWPGRSPPMETLPLRRTPRMVVPWGLKNELSDIWLRCLFGDRARLFRDLARPYGVPEGG